MTEQHTARYHELIAEEERVRAEFVNTRDEYYSRLQALNLEIITEMEKEQV